MIILTKMRSILKYYLITHFVFLFFPGVTAASTVTVNPDKTISIDGTPFFPIGAYCIGGGLPQDETQWQEASTWKLNFNSSPFVPELALPSLELGEKFKIYSHLSVGYADKYKNRDPNSITDMVNQLKGSPYIFAYGLPDEPPAQGLTPLDTEFGYKILKQADPAHPVILTYYKDFDIFKNSADIFILDFYPFQLGIPRERALYWFKDWYNRESANVSPKPLWPLIQAFGTKEDPTFYFFIPTKEEIRAETYLAIVLGSKAIIFYAYGVEPYNINNQPEIKAFLKNLTSELVGFSPIFLAEDSNRLSYASEDVDALLKEYSGKLYLIAVNKSPASVSVTFNISGVNTANAIRIGKPDTGASSKPGKTITVTEGKLTETFEGLAANIYEITPLAP